ncbi:MAG: hypothetical protein QM754_12020 [Tepidisphaeraceae bacterium]
MTIDEIMRHVETGLGNRRKRLREVLNQHVSFQESLTPENAVRMGEIADELGMSAEDVRGLLRPESKPATMLFIAPDARHDVGNNGPAVYLSEIITSGTPSGPEYNFANYLFVKSPSQPQAEFDQLKKLAAGMGPRGAGFSIKNANVVRAIVAAGFDARLAVHCHNTTLTHVALAKLYADRMRDHANADWPIAFRKIVKLPFNAPPQPPECWMEEYRREGVAFWNRFTEPATAARA